VRVCFVQKSAMSYFGVMSLAGYLRDSGHNFTVVIDSLEHDAVAAIVSRQPGVVGISVITSEHEWLIGICARIKSALPDIPLVIGGIHAVMYPEILAETRADFLCRSEGETVLRQMLDALPSPGGMNSCMSVPGLVYRKDLAVSGDLVLNPMPPLLPEITWEDDFELYYSRYPVLAKDKMKQFLSQRGCPYDCYFCYNHLIKQRFKGLGRYFRRKKPEIFVSEIQHVVERSPTRFVSILDDLFTSDRQWLREFTILYKSRIGKPFLCQIRADHADEELVSMLAQSGCFTACVGLETGDEKLREEVLNKKISNEKMFVVGDLLRKYHINLKTGNMFGIPGETEEMAFKTIELNIKIGTKFLGAAMLLPFPGTGIEKIALEKGWLEKPLDYKNLPASAYDESVFTAAQIPLLTNIMSIAQLSVFFPRLLPLLKKIVHLRCRPFFKFIHFSTLCVRFIRERNLGLFYGIGFLWRFRKSL
jgi:anaerobic magnesium-protoporphyrin IX monomethyl ester cyclase